MLVKGYGPRAKERIESKPARSINARTRNGVLLEESNPSDLKASIAEQQERYSSLIRRPSRVVFLFFRAPFPAQESR